MAKGKHKLTDENNRESFQLEGVSFAVRFVKTELPFFWWTHMELGNPCQGEGDANSFERKKWRKSVGLGSVDSPSRGMEKREEGSEWKWNVQIGI